MASVECDGRLKLPHFPEAIAAINVRFCELWIDANGFIEIHDCSIKLANIVKSISAIVVGQCPFGSETNCLTKICNCAVKIVLVLQIRARLL